MKSKFAFFGPWKLTSNSTAALIVAYLVLAANLSFWKNLLVFQPIHNFLDFLLVFSMGFVITGLIGVWFGFVGFKYLLKPAFAFLAIAAASAAYFMDRYGAMVDRHALQSVIETDVREGSEWLSWKMPLYFLWIAGPPLFLLWRTEIQYRKWSRELLARLGYLALCFAAILIPAGLMYQSMASVVRNHPELRHLINPYNVIMATNNYISHSVDAEPKEILPIAEDVKKGPTYQNKKPLLLVLVIGESARASSFSLGGYARPTNPLLSQRKLFYFNHVSSCGTNTATSLPCMFSNLGRDKYDEKTAKRQENLLDIIHRSGFYLNWADNNTGSKSIAARIGETDLSRGPDPVFCNAGGCYDEILLAHLQKQILDNTGDSVLLLHPLGSHGPAYHQRYPKAFEHFKPACSSGELQDCSRDEVLNAYENTIVYSDFVLDKIIAELEKNQTQRDVALLFVSDHGESTGEKGMYLHGAPYFVAPSEQTHVPMFLWMSAAFQQRRGLDAQCLTAQLNRQYSHDNFFHSVLGLLDLKTKVHQESLDIFSTCSRP
jgi:lipid A ethanolaminephosphotransferase